MDNGWMRKTSQEPNDDRVPVVRCRDCKHMGHDSVCALDCCLLFGHYTTRNDFCSRGKAKEV